MGRKGFIFILQLVVHCVGGGNVWRHGSRQGLEQRPWTMAAYFLHSSGPFAHRYIAPLTGRWDPPTSIINEENIQDLPTGQYDEGNSSVEALFFQGYSSLCQVGKKVISTHIVTYLKY